MVKIVYQNEVTLGKAHGKPFTKDLFSFTNSYFKVLLTEKKPSNLHILPSDEVLMTEAQSRAIVEEFAMDQKIFFQEFAKAYVKLTSVRKMHIDN